MEGNVINAKLATGTSRTVKLVIVTVTLQLATPKLESVISVKTLQLAITATAVLRDIMEILYLEARLDVALVVVQILLHPVTPTPPNVP